MGGLMRADLESNSGGSDLGMCCLSLLGVDFLPLGLHKTYEGIGGGFSTLIYQALTHTTDVISHGNSNSSWNRSIPHGGFLH